jgi:hypothetical protein
MMLPRAQAVGFGLAFGIPVPPETAVICDTYPPPRQASGYGVDAAFMLLLVCVHE